MRLNIKSLLLHQIPSPRGEMYQIMHIYDLGQGAGFYVNATQAPWSQHFKDV